MIIVIILTRNFWGTKLNLGSPMLKMLLYLCPSIVHRETPQRSGLNLESWGMWSATCMKELNTPECICKPTMNKHVCVRMLFTCPASCFCAVSYILLICWVNSAKFGMTNFFLKAFVSSTMLLPTHLKEDAWCHEKTKGSNPFHQQHHDLPAWKYFKCMNIYTYNWDARTVLTDSSMQSKLTDISLFDLFLVNVMHLCETQRLRVNKKNTHLPVSAGLIMN